MKLNEAFEIEAAMSEAKRDKDDLAYQVKVLRLKIMLMNNGIAVARAYLRSGQYEAARLVLEALP